MSQSKARIPQPLQPNGEICCKPHKMGLTRRFYKCIMGGLDIWGGKHSLDSPDSSCSFDPICHANSDFGAFKQDIASNRAPLKLLLP